MKQFVIVSAFMGLSLLFLQCKPNKVVSQQDVRVDTVFVNKNTEAVEKQFIINLTNMNVLYVGVDNPIHVDIIGSDTEKIRMRFSGDGTIKKVGDTDYIANVTNPGEIRLSVRGNDKVEEFSYKVKRVPNPVARLSNSNGGPIGSGEFKAQGGLSASLDNFDFDCICTIEGFNLTYVAKRSDPVEVINSGARFNDKSKRLISAAKPGDIYYFTNVRAKCPGDNASRKINSLVFQIR